MKIRPYVGADRAEWRRMRDILFLGQTEQDMTSWLTREDSAVIVAERDSGGLCGFAEVGTRSYAEGCDSKPVAYLEGWYVDEDSRGRGVGRLLVRAVVDWATTRGFSEIASDTHVTNHTSQKAHERLGFVEVDRAVLYRKALTPSD